MTTWYNEKIFPGPAGGLLLHLRGAPLRAHGGRLSGHSAIHAWHSAGRPARARLLALSASGRSLRLARSSRACRTRSRTRLCTAVCWCSLMQTTFIYYEWAHPARGPTADARITAFKAFCTTMLVRGVPFGSGMRRDVARGLLIMSAFGRCHARTCGARRAPRRSRHRVTVAVVTVAADYPAAVVDDRRDIVVTIAAQRRGVTITIVLGAVPFGGNVSAMLLATPHAWWGGMLVVTTGARCLLSR